MSFSDIQGTPLQIDLKFVQANSTDTIPDHGLAGKNAPSGFAAGLLSQFPPDVQMALSQLFGTPLDQLFNQKWIDLQGTVQTMVQQAVLSAQPNAYQINVSVPPSGSLRAEAGVLSPGMLEALPPFTQASQLTLQYSVPGFSVSINERTDSIWGAWADPSYNLTFDGILEVDIAVPADPVAPLVAKVFFITTNMQASAGNFFAVLIGIEDAVSAFLSDQPQGSGSSLQDQIVGVNILAVQQLFAQLSTGFAMVAGFGFTQMSVQVATQPVPASGAPEGNTVEFDLTHSFDPGPVVRNVASMGPMFTPQIGAGAPEVNAGGALGITGTNFPAAQATQLTITWNDTTSGSVVESEVQWGLASNGQPPAQPVDVKIARQGPNDNKNNFQVTGLSPNTSYAFQVRDFDVKDLIASMWSNWAVFTTAASDQVQLVLSYQTTFLGIATLQSDGTFSTTVTIPNSVPPGTYQISAVLGGQTVAQTAVTVVAQGQQLSALLQSINPITGIAFTGTLIVLGGSPEAVRGENFNSGTVNLYIDSTGGTSLGSGTADATGTFKANFFWPIGVLGPHNILAQQGALQATVAVYADSPPS
jgi:hypothetical protein